MDAPPDKENIEPFIRVAGLMARSQVNVPAIFQQNLTDGFLLLEDFGSQCFLDQLNARNAAELYESAFDALFNLQTKTVIENCGLPAITKPLLQRELAIFEDWFLKQLWTFRFPHHFGKQCALFLSIQHWSNPLPAYTGITIRAT